jgi:hypothetical protein
MTLQTLLILGVVAGAAAYLARGVLGSFGRGCASGCGGCGKPCPVKKLEALAAQSRSGGPSSSSPDSSKLVMKR